MLDTRIARIEGFPAWSGSSSAWKNRFPTWFGDISTWFCSRTAWFFRSTTWCASFSAWFFDFTTWFFRSAVPFESRNVPDNHIGTSQTGISAARGEV